MISVRSAREDEISALTAIGLSAWEKAVSGLADAAGMRVVAELSFLSFLRSNWFLVIVIAADGIPLGWAAREDGDGTISDLWIAPAVQRSGFGSMLMTDLERRVLEDGFEVSFIKTHAQNAQAIGFFRKHGYSISSLSTAYAPKLDRDVESVGMKKILQETAQQLDHQWF